MDKKLKREINLQVSGLCVREAEDGQKSRTVEGYAVVFGVRSVNLTPWSSDREVYEIMEPGSITQDLLSRSDVVLTAFHNNQMILGRWRMGKGTLTLELDQRGLKIRCTLAETATADELLAAIERGDITGMSFAFTADEEDNVNGVVYEKTSERAASGKAFSILAVAEGAFDKDEANLKKKDRARKREEAGIVTATSRIAAQVQAGTGIDTRVCVPGHMLRGGSPSAYDRILATKFGVHAAKLISTEKYGRTVAMVNGKVTSNKLADIAGLTKFVDPKDQLVVTAKRIGVSFGD